MVLPSQLTREDLAREAEIQLKHGGITFTLKHIGSIKLVKSVREMSLKEQGAISRLCMKTLVDALSDNFKSEEVQNSKYAEFFSSEAPKIVNLEIELNVSSHIILLIRNSYPKSKIRTQDISIISPGLKEFSTYFCIIAHIKNKRSMEMSRECLVFMADEHKEMRSIYNTIKLAFELFEKKDTNVPEFKTPLPISSMIKKPLIAKSAKQGGLNLRKIACHNSLPTHSAPSTPPPICRPITSSSPPIPPKLRYVEKKTLETDKTN